MIAPATAGHMLETVSWMKNTLFQFNFRNQYFGKPTEESYEQLTDMACYQYEFHPCFEERRKLKMESGISMSLYTSGKTIKTF